MQLSLLEGARAQSGEAGVRGGANTTTEAGVGGSGPRRRPEEHLHTFKCYLSQMKQPQGEAVAQRLRVRQPPAIVVSAAPPATRPDGITSALCDPLQLLSLRQVRSLCCRHLQFVMYAMCPPPIRANVCREFNSRTRRSGAGNTTGSHGSCSKPWAQFVFGFHRLDIVLSCFTRFTL
ncbi:hypothetical protein ACQ4PT_056691 [Festuca glaucescens]